MLAPVAAMATLLDEEIREVESFVGLLRQEQELLVAGGKDDALLPLVKRKSELTTRLEAFSARREQILATSGQGKGRAGMDAWLAAAPAADASRARWPRLLALAAEARQLNETNGKLIGIHWQHNQAALATLMAATNRAMTYGPDGQQKTGGGSRSFGNA
ncbi:MAG: flagellar protein FlgN [Rhodocyclaceae bacterium]|nr:flagellar protein FlgN [Rhodocyclaceae bacterium]